MLSRSLLKWTVLTTVSVIIIVLVSALVDHHRVSAASDDASTRAALRVVDEKGKLAAEFPLKHTEVKAQVSGFLSRVTVTQDYENNFPEKIEAVYTFPLPQAAAVDEMTMLIGQRSIKAKIMRREEAKTAYDNARQAGQVASLLDQERPNIFTQQVANIMPGQSIRITISYVETLKYEDGSYEWTFPMVVGPRYIPASDPQEIYQMSTRPPDETRAGQDISLEIDVDAGVPIVDANSETHETEVEQINDRHAVVRLKDRSTIPNKDFVLTYRVAGDTINEALLTHRTDRGGFFTLILQPPQRVAPEDVMPKELVFVLDTSGSMNGFPIEKAKQTMNLALKNLYPHDTFNLITFAGETEILFPEPVPATPENLRKAAKFLHSHETNGGTEMMKAIKAALEPSDSQYHVRIVCFMTDGLVWNDMEIISEVQKHPNARVFAMGFSSSPNRFLLDKIAEYGRGEVDYVSETGDTSAVARRFHERIRNPLLTDVTVDWSNLPVSDVYPKHLPDLFSAKPLIVTGRYSTGGEGTIRLKGKMGGQEFIRDIPVRLPEVEPSHDVLATLWARRKVDDLMGRQMAAGEDQTLQDQQREEITQLGLTFKLMTQYTSFVAIDDLTARHRGDVPAETVSALPFGGVSECVTVASGGAAVIDTSNISQTQTITARAIEDLPLQGRSVQSLIPPSPGVATDARRLVCIFMVDGVNANFGIAAGGETPGTSAAGNAPALTASGGTNGIVSLGATQELEVQTSPIKPEYGHPQIAVITRSGTNEFQGSAFHFFGNDSLDANDWFANSRGLKQPPKRLNLFGATLGGPIQRDQTFFFASYEGLRLRQPVTGLTSVPSLPSRSAAPSGIRSFFEAFPLPNGAPGSDGFAEFAATFANPAQHDVGSVRVDHLQTANTAFNGRYTFADSDAMQRGANGSSLNTANRIRNRAQTITGSLNHTLSSTAVFELHANYSRSRVNSSYLLDGFDGAVVPDNLFPASSFTFDLNSRNAALIVGDEARSVQRQLNLAGSTAIIAGNHSFKFGGDYRRLSPILGQRPVEENALFHDVTQALTGVAARLNRITHSAAQKPVFTNVSLFGQDEWKQSLRLTLTYGMRWELAPAPATNDPTRHTPGSSFWKTTFANFAPRAGFAYQLSQTSGRELVLRGGVGILYDLSQDRSADAFTDSIPFVSGSSDFNTPFPGVAPSASTASNLPFMAFDPKLKLPYTINWNVSLQRALGDSQALSATYLGSTGKRLLHTQTLLNQNPDFTFLRLVTNQASSDYRALQVKFDRQLSQGLMGQVSYTWAQLLDNVTEDSARRVIMTSASPALDRGPSDFDIRHQLTGFISYALPAPVSQGIGNKLLRNWTVDSIFNARSAKPLNVLYLVPTSFGVAYLRPNVVNDTAFYIFDPAVAGGRRLNTAAFVVPSNLQQGNLARNSLRGFPFYQMDLALRRKFSFSETVALQIQADAFNFLNHTNFEDPLGNDLVAGGNFRFGESTSVTGRSLSSGGFGSFYSFGGARTLRLSVKLLF